MRVCLSKLPTVLIAHLKRLVFDFDAFENRKINTRFEFPTELNIEPYTKAVLDAKRLQGAARAPAAAASSDGGVSESKERDAEPGGAAEGKQSDAGVCRGGRCAGGRRRSSSPAGASCVFAQMVATAGRERSRMLALVPEPAVRARLTLGLLQPRSTSVAADTS
jgi:hypothetical protein